MIDFAALLGSDHLYLRTGEMIARGSFQFREPGAEEHETIVRGVRAHVRHGNLDTTDSPGRQEIWDRCWGAVAAGFKNGGDLVPEFLARKQWPMRLHGRFILPEFQRFEMDWTAVLRSHLFEKYFAPVEVVHEFGCGSGHNLYALARQQRGKILHGYDWSAAAVRSLKMIRERYNIPIHGHHFNFFDPPVVMEMRSWPTGVLTVGALEQVGNRFRPFLNMLLASRPNIVVHVEPLLELYAEDDELDLLAKVYHLRRKYLEGYLPALQGLARIGRVEILELRRTNLGSFYHDPYMVLAWRPS